MIRAIQNEVNLRKTYLANQPLETIYFGGGTPSILTKDEMQSILNTIKENFQLADQLEFTIEANPDDIHIEALKCWKALGVNRLSIGLQSFREEDLKWMNRAHTSQEALNCVKLAQQEGFENISVDLIYGLPNLSLEEWKQNIQTVIDMHVPHVSAYCLTVEEKTALHKMVKNHTIKPANEEEQSDQFETLVEMLALAGLEQYEISNFSKIGLHAVHNSNYWKGKHYLGIGPSAHSFDGKSRSWNIANNQQYIKKIKENEEWFETEILSKENQFNELLLVGLRTKFGVDYQRLKSIMTLPVSFENKLNDFISNNWITLNNDTIQLTHEGKLKADHIASELFVV